jgi:RNA exonuclease NGL2
MLLAELASYGNSDIICLQECDRLTDLAPALPSHQHVSTKGRNKLHGLVIFYIKSKFRLKAEKTVYLDEEELSPSPSPSPSRDTTDKASADDRRRRGGSRQTKNVGLVASLEEIGENEAGKGKGLVVATTHL